MPNYKLHILILFLFVLVFVTKSFAQDDLLSMVEKNVESKKDITNATFKTTRLVNGHTIENTAKGVLDLRISHKFGFVNSGFYEMFGLDQASMRLGFDYGITDRLMIGLGRSTYQKQYDGFLKYKILRQASGTKGASPVSLSAFSGAMYNSLRWADPTRQNYASSRLSFANQLLVARKFSENLSLQLMPSFVHYNMVSQTTDPNDIFALGFGGRIKLSKRISFNGEYYAVLPIKDKPNTNYKLSGTKNSLALGFDIETGGHVFQLYFANATSITENAFIGQTAGDFFNGDIHFGFCISRVFTVKDYRKQ